MSMEVRNYSFPNSKLKVKVMISDELGFCVTSTLIMGEKDCVLVDCQWTRSNAYRVIAEICETNLNLKADRYEWQVFRFVQQLLSLLGVSTEEIRFQRQCIANESETISDIAAMRPDIDRRTALKLNPYIQPEEIDALLQQED